MAGVSSLYIGAIEIDVKTAVAIEDYIKCLFPRIFFNPFPRIIAKDPFPRITCIKNLL